jgi:DNA invertase Pin-like site-specific DNA recombinase
MSDKVKAQHIARKAMLYVRQSSAYQVTHNLESQKLQYAMQDRLRQLGWREIEVVDEDLGRSAAGTVTRTGFERMVSEVCLGKVGAVAAWEVSRFARNSREWQQLMEVCRIVDTLLVDQDTVYAPRQSNDRLLLGLKGSLNEYELDLLRQRSVEARYAKARRGALLQAVPVGYVKTEEQRLEKDPDRRVQQAIALVFRTFTALGTVRQTLWWFLEHGLELPTHTPRGATYWRRPSYRTVYRLLTSPVYGGAYAYGKTEQRVRFTEAFRTLGAREVLPPEVLQLRLLLCLHGLGTNAGLKRMCSGGGPDGYAELQYVRRRYLTKEQLRGAIARVCNAIFQVRNPALWGEGTTPVKPFKNVTFLLIVAPLEMLPCSVAEHAREPPRSELPQAVGRCWTEASRRADAR